MPDDATGVVEGWERVWQTGSYGGARAWAVRFSSEGAARNAIGELLDEQLADAVASFPVEGLPGVTGLRVLGYAWLLVQLPDVGPYVDFVHLLYGDVRILIAVANLPTGSGHELATALAQEVAERSASVS